MTDKESIQARAHRLHDAEEAEKAIAEQLPDGEERDRHFMAGERLSDEAWSLEEANDIEPRPSGIWPPIDPTPDAQER